MDELGARQIPTLIKLHCTRGLLPRAVLPAAPHGELHRTALPAQPHGELHRVVPMVSFLPQPLLLPGQRHQPVPRHRVQRRQPVHDANTAQHRVSIRPSSIASHASPSPAADTAQHRVSTRPLPRQRRNGRT